MILGRRARIRITPAASPPALGIVAVPGTQYGRVGQPFSFQLQATGGVPFDTGERYRFFLKPGEIMNPGLSLNEAGAISGTLDQVGTGSFEVGVLDAAGTVAYTTVDIEGLYPELRVVVPQWPPAEPGAAFGPYIVAVEGGDGTGSFAAPSWLPAGATFNTGTGSLGGTIDASESGQTRTGEFIYTSGDGQVARATATIAVQAITAPGWSFAYPVFPQATVGVAYGPVAPTETGGTGTTTYGAFGGFLGELTVDSATGAISGTLSSAYAGLTLTASIVGTDSASPPRSHIVQVAIPVAPAAPVPVAITPPTFTAATPGSVYSVTATATPGGGTWGYDGELPEGMTFSAGTWSAADVGDSAANRTFTGSYWYEKDGQRETLTWSISVDALPVVSDIPEEVLDIPDTTFSNGVAQTIEYTLSPTYVDLHGKTITGLSVVSGGPLPAGLRYEVDVAAGKLRKVYDGTAIQATQQSGANSLDLTYSDPVITPGGSDAEQEWQATIAMPGVRRYTDFREFGSTTELRAATAVSGNTYLAGNYEVNLTTAGSRVLTGGKALQILTHAAAVAQGGIWWWDYLASRAPVRRGYLRWRQYFGRDGLAWVSNSDSVKTFYLESYNGGQIWIGNHQFRGFVGFNVNPSDGWSRLVDGRRYTQNAIDNGGPQSTTLERLRRYGPGGPLDSVGDFSLSLGSATPLLYDRAPSWPDATCLAAGAIAYPHDGYMTQEVWFDCDLRQFKSWAAYPGQRPRLISSSEFSDRQWQPESYQMRYCAVSNYATGRAAEAGRPTQETVCNDIVFSDNEIPFPGFFGEALPQVWVPR